jgi:hypothetical protein
MHLRSRSRNWILFLSSRLQPSWVNSWRPGSHNCSNLVGNRRPATLLETAQLSRCAAYARSANLAHGNFPLDSPVLTVVTFRNSSNVDSGFLVQQTNW